MLSTGAASDSLAAARFARRGLPGLIAWPSAEPVFDAALLARVYAYQVIVLDELARHGVGVRFTDAPPLDDQAPPRHHRRQISQPMPRASHPARNPSRPRRLGRSRNMINENCETRGHPVGARNCVHRP